jgi:membrane-bound ClpP family serine protease
MLSTLGIAMALVGLGLVVLEAHVNAGGAIAVIGGLGAVAGLGLVLADSGVGTVPTIVVSILLAVVVLGMLGLGLAKIRSALRAEVQTGPQRLIGAKASVCNWDGDDGQVILDGSVWAARLDPGWESSVPPAPGDVVIVERLVGLTLTVRPRQFWELEAS